MNNMNIEKMWIAMLNKCGMRSHSKNKQDQLLIEQQRNVIEQQRHIIEQQRHIIEQQRHIIERITLYREKRLIKEREEQRIMHKQLRKGQRYLFTEKLPKSNKKKIFRANVVNIFKDSITTDCNENTNKQMTRTIPLDWIINVESFYTITKKQLRLPPEIMDIIDSYL